MSVLVTVAVRLSNGHGGQSGGNTESLDELHVVYRQVKLARLL